MCLSPSAMLSHAYFGALRWLQYLNQHWGRGKSHKCFKICDEYCRIHLMQPIKPRFTDDCLIRTPHYYSVITHYCFVPGERNPSLRKSFVSPRSSPLRDVSRGGNVPQRRWARRNFCHSQAKESRYIFYKFNPLNADAALIRTLFMAPSVSLLTGFDWSTVSNWRVRSVTVALFYGTIFLRK